MELTKKQYVAMKQTTFVDICICKNFDFVFNLKQINTSIKSNLVQIALVTVFFFDDCDMVKYSQL